MPENKTNEYLKGFKEGLNFVKRILYYKKNEEEIKKTYEIIEEAIIMFERVEKRKNKLKGAKNGKF